VSEPNFGASPPKRKSRRHAIYHEHGRSRSRRDRRCTRKKRQNANVLWTQASLIPTPHQNDLLLKGIGDGFDARRVTLDVKRCLIKVLSLIPSMDLRAKS